VTGDGAVQRIDLLEPQCVKVECQANLAELLSDLCMLGVERPRHVRLIARKTRKQEHVLGVDVTQDGPLQLVPLTLDKLCILGQGERTQTLKARLELFMIELQAGAGLCHGCGLRQGPAGCELRSRVVGSNG
jgi:hypothetical protein